MKVDCAACHHVALLTRDFPLKLGLSPRAKVLDLRQHARCRRCGARGRAVVSVEWRAEITGADVAPPLPWTRNSATGLMGR